jgi:AbrB family looped-hinge helix DNA binding protein
MKTVTISSKYQVVIPQNIRKRLNLKPGQKIQAFVYRNRIELIPVAPVEIMRGFIRGLDTKVERRISERGPADET